MGLDVDGSIQDGMGKCGVIKDSRADWIVGFNARGTCLVAPSNCIG